MNNSVKNINSIWVYIIAIFGLLFYLYGFFPINNSRLAHNRKTHEGTRNNKKSIDKLALIVIDSLRYDFVHPKNTNLLYMPFMTSSVFQNKSCLLSAKVDSPTVTMPRIKAMTSGSPSNYLDLIFNLMSSNYDEDNFITKAASKGLSILFYGDDTWLKLFPKSFLRSEGTSSFFVMDFTEVDQNVTRHIDKELKNKDWDIIILHYLGLDHIGHIEGPNSLLMKPKLQEMDEIIRKISNEFELMEEENGLKTMVIVTSDHGMKDSGGHGGVTDAETTVPLVSVGKACRILPGWPESFAALQIDIAPTLCALFDLPLPLNNVGKIIPTFLYYMTNEEITRVLEMNRLHLVNMNDDLESVNEFHSKLKKIKESLSKHETEETIEKLSNAKYYESLSQISQNLANSSFRFKHFYLILGLIILWHSLFLILYQCSSVLMIPQTHCQSLLFFGTIFHGLSLSSTSFIEEEHQTWYFLWITFCLLVVVEFLSEKEVPRSENAKNCTIWIILCLTHRILRKLNQTGEKWAFLPDLKIYLISAEGQELLLLLFLTALIMIFLLTLVENCCKQQLISFGGSLLCVFWFRVSTGSVKVFNLLADLFPASLIGFQILMYIIFLTVFIIQSFYYKTAKYLIWVLFGSLLLKPHNMVLIPVEVFISKQTHRFFNKKNQCFWIGIIHVWLGHLFYFYQGNSNSLANVDVTSAFIGIKSYNPLYAGIMILAHTYYGQILSFMLCPKLHSFWIMSRLIPLTMYCTVLMFQLYHLFIWSVFSPKLLYEATLTLLYLILMVIRNLFQG